MRNTLLYYIGVLALALCAVTMHGATREEVLSRYTPDDPLVVYGTTNNAPYDFSNKDGQPDGYNADVVRHLLNRMGVPYVYVNKEWSETRSLFEGGKVDLIIAADMLHFKGNPHMGEAILAPLHMAVAYHKGQGEVTSLHNMPHNASVFMPRQGVTLRKAVAAGIDTASVFFVEPTYCLSSLNSGEDGYLLWNELSIRNSIRELHLSNMEVRRIRMGANAVRFCSYDADLINILDEEYGRMELRGEVEELQIKWFYPERKRTTFSSLAYSLLSMALVVLVVVVVLNRVVMVHRMMRQRKVRRASRIMSAAIRLDGRNLIRFENSTGIVRNESGDFLPGKGLLPEQYLEHIHPDDRPVVYGHMHFMKMATSRDVFTSPVYRWSPDGNPEGPWRTVMLQSVIEYTEEGLRSDVISTVSDITDELERSRKEEDTTEMFYRIFDNAILGMAIYSPQGELLESNRRLSEIFRIAKGEGGGYFYGNNLFNMPSLQGVLDRTNPKELWICTSIHPGDWNKKIFIELHVTPVHSEHGELIFLLVAVRDITDDVVTYRQHKDELVRLNTADEQLRMREDELRILLRTARMRLWTLSHDNRTIAFNSSPGAPEWLLTWDEFLGHASDDDSRANLQSLLDEDPKVIKAARLTVAMDNLLGTTDGMQWYAISVLGRTVNEDTGEDCLFGLALNITQSIRVRQSFEAEKQRATESEHQKTRFLNSMTHEIRTPLNSIVGFSEVLPMLEAEERELIVNTIKENCDKLLRLTDDILTISAMDAKELKFEYKEIDFSKAFDDEFEHLRIYTDQNSSVEYIKDNPCPSLMVRIDMQRISQILTNFLGNAVKYTTEGFIKLGYSCDGTTLRIYCQDTGTGISKDRQKSVFERFFQVDSFVQGTGMGLSVCKAIAEAMDGRIGVESEEGKGSTFYVEIPIMGGAKLLTPASS